MKTAFQLALALTFLMSASYIGRAADARRPSAHEDTATKTTALASPDSPRSTSHGVNPVKSAIAAVSAALPTKATTNSIRATVDMRIGKLNLENLARRTNTVGGAKTIASEKWNDQSSI